MSDIFEYFDPIDGTTKYKSSKSDDEEYDSLYLTDDGDDDEFEDFFERRKRNKKRKANKYKKVKEKDGKMSKSTTTYNTTTNPNSTMYVNHNQSKPAIAFSIDDVVFIGTAKTYLNDITLYSTDLIINCTGVEFSPLPPKPFIKKVPTWLSIETDKEGAVLNPPSQLLLDWTDFGSPPDRIDISFWRKILEEANKAGIKRIICCCTGGYGRTGTALAAFLLASDSVSEPDEAIDFVKKEYREKAIESKSQIDYLWGLIYTDEEILDIKKEKEEEIKRENNALMVLEGPKLSNQAKDTDVTKKSDEYWIKSDEFDDWISNYGD